MNINKNVSQFIKGIGKSKGRIPDERYASFDYCFNYFQSFREKGNIEKIASRENMEMSCLHLAFYLASWGMLRGSTLLLEKSIKYYEPLIANIAMFDKRIWKIDADKFTEENIELLLKCRDMISKSLGNDKKPTDTLITKIMLGVFSNVPAYDGFFKKGFHVQVFGKTSLRKIAKFYNDNKETIDEYKIHTFGFSTGKKTHRKYTKAKIIDMIGFIEGQNKRK